MSEAGASQPPAYASAAVSDRRRGKQKVFVESYLSNGHNASAASVSAGYAPGRRQQQGYDLMHCPEVQAAIEKRAREIARATEMSTLTWARDLSAIAFMDPGKIFDENGRMLHVKYMPEQVRRGISRVSVKETIREEETTITTEVTFWDKNAALVTVAKHLGLFERDNRQKSENVSLVVRLV